MAKSLEQLRTELSKIAEENRKAYDALYSSPNGTGFAPSNSVNSRYEAALKKGSVPAELKAEYDRLAAAYKKTQETKNSIAKEFNAAEKAAKAEKVSGASKKSAQVAADKALEDLKIAEGKIDSYNGPQDYVTAYQKAQTAVDALVKAGGKAVPLPEKKMEVPAPGTKIGPDGKPQIDQSKIKEPTLTELQNTLADPKNKQQLLDFQKDLAKNFGYKGNVDGQWSTGFQKALQDALALRASVPEVLRGTDFRSFVSAPPFKVTSTTGSGAGANGTTTTTYQTISSPTQAESEINKVFQQELGRDATAAEIKALSPVLQKAQADNPARYTTTTVDGNSKTKQVSGIDTTQYLVDQLKTGVGGKLANIKTEYEQAKLNAPEVTNRLAEKKIYDTAVKAGKDVTGTAYGRGVSALADRIGMQAIQSGASLADDEIKAIAEEAYAKAVDKDPYALQSFIDEKMKFGANKEGAYTGQAGKYVADLEATARANGLDLKKNFGGNLNSWLTALQKGEAIDTFKNIIRQTASLGMPEKVAGLIGKGVDLDTIYSPYKNVLAQTLEISPETISLSDPTLRQAISPTGEMSIYDYQRQLRQDPRWQYTNQARSEVADITRQVLNDFGFQG